MLYTSGGAKSDANQVSPSAETIIQMDNKIGAYKHVVIASVA